MQALSWRFPFPFVHGLDLHRYVPSAPDDGADIADFLAVAEQMDGLALFEQRHRVIADGHDDVVCRKFDDALVLVFYGDFFVGDVLDTGA